MSFGVHQLNEFHASVQGKAVVFLVPDRQTNLLLARLFLASAAAAEVSCHVLDMDAFYASNSVSIAEGFSQQEMKDIQLQIPTIRAGGEVVPEFFPYTDEGFVVIDDLNSLYHTFSSADEGTAGRKLTFLVQSLSFMARTNRLTILATVYERERPVFTRRRRLFAGLGDASVSARREGGLLALRCDRGAIWPGRTLILSIRP